MSLTGKDTEAKTQNYNIVEMLKLITARLDILEVSRNPPNPVNMNDVRRIHQHHIPQVRRQADRARQVQQGEDQFGDYDDEFEE
ncbi:hypothetical protein HAX54_044205, partial [Datura stramonium]|nr:hypothetical protein [Datura stramonium]